MLINRYTIEITDSGKARKIYDQMDFYGQMDGCKDIERENYVTSWTKREGNHSWEEKTYIFTDSKEIKIKLHLNTPHYKDKIDSREIERPIRNKETLEIIIFKEGGTLDGQEIKNSIDKIEKLTGMRGIKNL